MIHLLLSLYPTDSIYHFCEVFIFYEMNHFGFIGANILLDMVYFEIRIEDSDLNIINK